MHTSPPPPTHVPVAVSLTLSLSFLSTPTPTPRRQAVKCATKDVNLRSPLTDAVSLLNVDAVGLLLHHGATLRADGDEVRGWVGWVVGGTEYWTDGPPVRPPDASLLPHHPTQPEPSHPIKPVVCLLAGGYAACRDVQRCGCPARMTTTTTFR